MFYIFDPNLIPPKIYDTPDGREALKKWRELFAMSKTAVITALVDPKMLFERFEAPPRAIHVDKPEISTAREHPDAKIALPGQYPPMRRPGFVSVKSAGKADCAVVAAANVLGLDYKAAKVQCFQHGWSSTKGLPRGFLELLLKNRALVALFRPDLCGLTVDRLRKMSPLGIYLVYVAGHVMPLVEEVLCNVNDTDWQSIDEVYEVQPLKVVEALQEADNVV